MRAPGDSEADHYRLLAYVQRVHGRYQERKLYPHLDELRRRLEQLQDLRRRRDVLTAGMPRDVIGLDLRRQELMRAATHEDELLRAIDQMIRTGLPELGHALERGAELRDRFAAHIRFEPVGLLPLSVREGYLLLHQGRDARAYAYTLTLPAIPPGTQAHHVMRTRFVAAFPIGITSTYEWVKADLVRADARLPNPAVFAFYSHVTLPTIETFVPLAKQLVYETVRTHSV
jgi:hypothetical protein